jgi:hypothetical protein
MESAGYVEGGALDRDLVIGVAAVMRHRAASTGGTEKLGERRDLEPVTAAVLSEAFPKRVVRDHKYDVLAWPKVGRVDVVVKEAKGVLFASHLIELKWSGPGGDKIVEGIWDAFKMALCTQLVEAPRAYLLTGAHMKTWETSPFSDVFDTAEHDPVELCMRRLPGKNQTLVWDYLLDGGYDNYPSLLPGRITTEICGRAQVGEWELRAVEVIVPDDTEMISMTGGWPHGERPVEAKHPVANEHESRFVDTADDIQVDPATLPENIELLRAVDAEIARAHEEDDG